MSELVCDARIRIDDPHGCMERLCTHFREHAVRVEIGQHLGVTEFSFGTALLRADAGSLRLEARAADLASLAYVRLTLAHHVLDLPEATSTSELVWYGDGCEDEALPYFRAARVRENRRLTPRMRRLTLEGTDLERFTTGGLHVRLVIPPAGCTTPAWPKMGRNGLPVFPQGPDKPEVRCYTVRRIDAEAGLMEVDLVLHEGESVGAAFAERAQAGDPVGIMGPGGGDVGEADWYLLAGDATALPAIARILEELPAHARGVALVAVPAASEEMELVRPAGFELRWLHEDRPGGVDLVAEMRDVRPPADKAIFVWGAAEFARFKEMRRFCRDELKLGKTQHLVAAYWRRGLREGETPTRD